MNYLHYTVLFISLFSFFGSMNAGKIYLSVLFNETSTAMNIEVTHPDNQTKCFCSVPAAHAHTEPLLLGTFTYNELLDYFKTHSSKLKFASLGSLDYGFSIFFDVTQKGPYDTRKIIKYSIWNDLISNNTKSGALSLPDDFSSEDDIYLKFLVEKKYPSGYSVSVQK